MRRFFCQCGQEIFFENTHCGVCGSQLGFIPELQQLSSLQEDDNAWLMTDLFPLQRYRSCEHRDHELACNWLIPADSPNTQCISCALTRTIPMLTQPDNWRRWRTLEAAKRRMIYGLLRLNLPINAFYQGYEHGLVFDFLEDQRTNPDLALEHVLSGHSQGVITLNAAEADGSFREATREAMNESYRTLLGHFRHEIGHYYWDTLIKGSENYPVFCDVFSFTEQDYQSSLTAYYNDGPAADWSEFYLSAYASAHPLEDWAETWAHYLMMSDTMETAVAYGLIDHFDYASDFDVLMTDWLSLVVKMNALNRSVGNTDAYPFVVSASVRKKLKFIHQLLNPLKKTRESVAFL